MKHLYSLIILCFMLPVRLVAQESSPATKPTGDVNIQNSNITIQGKRLELQSGIRIDKNFNFQNR